MADDVCRKHSARRNEFCTRRHVVELADIQNGVVAHRQLVEMGFRAGWIHRRTQESWLYPVHKGVLAVGRRQLTQNGHRMAAVLACGSDALLSHFSAAALWGLLPNRNAIEVTTPRRGLRRPGIRVHYTSQIHAEDISQLHNIPVTSVARTILDLAPLLPTDRLLTTIEAAARQRLFSLLALDRAIARSPRRRGVRKLQAVLAAYREPPDTRSRLEEQFWELIREARVPPPEVNVLVAGLVVDFFWPKTRLVVELDSRAYHQNPRAFEDDRRRDARLLRHNCRVLRVTHQRMKRDRAALLDDVKALATPPRA